MVASSIEIVPDTNHRRVHEVEPMQQVNVDAEPLINDGLDVLLVGVLRVVSSTAQDNVFGVAGAVTVTGQVQVHSISLHHG